jgi:lipoprotein-anchoring transpeptidase ErfK/SrfK
VKTLFAPNAKPRIAGVAAAILLAALLSGCASLPPPEPEMAAAPFDPSIQRMYAGLANERYPVPAVDLRESNPEMLRQVVDYETSEPVGTIVIDTAARRLYLVQEDGKALRYGVGVGKAGLAFEGDATIGRKAEWPRWTPTPDMIKRDPKRYAAYTGGLDGGLENPLGARALYLYQGPRDTLFRIHGTNEPDTIGHAVSSGCIRMVNQDVIDLFGRAPVGTRVVVRQSSDAQS